MNKKTIPMDHLVWLQIICTTILLVISECKFAHGEDHDPVKTITYKDENGIEFEEHAFREPQKGLPGPLLDLFCSNVKMRLYWNVYREEIKEGRRKGIHLRQMSRLARHLFAEIRDADKPFDGPMLSTVDEYFQAPADSPSKVDKALNKLENQPTSGATDEHKSKLAEKRSNFVKKVKGKIEGMKATIARNETNSLGGSTSDQMMQELESSDSMRELEKQGFSDTKKKIKNFITYWGPKVALGVYTRYRTMWWLMLSCLFTKYYLWDPALDEFMKLQRNLVLWPQLQLAKLQELDCKPINFFRRIIDTCRVLNPLLRFDFGQLDLDKLTRFKSDS